MLYGIEQTIYYTAWDTENNIYKAGDVANHTLFWNKDGVAAAPVNVPEEVDATNQPGLYKLLLTEVETQCLIGRLHGKTSTNATILIFQDIGPVRLPNEVFNSQYGLALGGYIEGRTRPAAEYALEASVQSIKTIGGSGPWTTAVVDLSDLALESSVQTILTTGGSGPWTTAVIDLSDVALEASVQQVLTTGGTGPWTTTTPIDISDLALEASVQQVLTIGGLGPWTTTDIDVSSLALEASVQQVLSTGGTGPWTTGTGSDLTPVMNILNKLDFNSNEVLQVDVQWWQGIEISGVNMIEDPTGEPRWTIRALSNSPAGAGRTIAYVSAVQKDLGGYLNILRGDTLVEVFNLGFDIVDQEEIIFAIKEAVTDTNEESLLFISSLTGLMFVNKQPADDPTNGSITILSSEAGILQITCDAEEMSKLPIRNRNSVMEVQLRMYGDSVFTPLQQGVSILGDVIRN